MNPLPASSGLGWLAFAFAFANLWQLDRVRLCVFSSLWLCGSYLILAADSLDETIAWVIRLCAEGTHVLVTVFAVLSLRLWCTH